MQGVHQAIGADSEEHVDTAAALWLLASLAALHRLPFDADLVIKQFPPPFDLPTLIDALGALGLKAGLTPWPEAAPGAPEARQTLAPTTSISTIASSASGNNRPASPVPPISPQDYASASSPTAASQATKSSDHPAMS